MSVSDKLYLFAFINFCLCSAVGWVCLCRLATLDRTSRRLFRALYACLMVAAAASGFQPLLFQEWPGFADLIVNLTLLFFIASGMRTWRNGPPSYAQSGPVPLSDDVLHQVVGGKGGP